MKNKNIKIILRIWMEFIVGPIFGVSIEDGYLCDIDDVEVVMNNKEIQEISHKIGNMYNSYFEFNSHNVGCYYNTKKELKERDEMLRLVTRLKKILKKVNDGSYLVEDFVSDRLKNLGHPRTERYKIYIIKLALIESKDYKTHDEELYCKTQILLAYNSCAIDGYNITQNEVEEIFNNNSNTKELLIRNHFELFDYMLETIDDKLSMKMIKKYYSILKYKVTSTNKSSILSNSDELKKLIKWYNSIFSKNIEDIIEFYLMFEKLHSFQNFNGIIGRMIVFRECLVNNIMPFIIENDSKGTFLKELDKYIKHNEKNGVLSICKKGQNKYRRLVHKYIPPYTYK